jgi:hypothetical protein
MSASRSPTLAPSFVSAAAKFTAVVDLPTPPLPEPTAMMCLTPDKGLPGGLGPDSTITDDDMGLFYHKEGAGIWSFSQPVARFFGSR